MLVREVEKNETERIRISTEEFKGRKYVDIRIYYENEEGEWKPTKKGVALGPDIVGEVIEGLQGAKKSLEK